MEKGEWGRGITGADGVPQSAKTQAPRHGPGKRHRRLGHRGLAYEAMPRAGCGFPSDSEPQSRVIPTAQGNAGIRRRGWYVRPRCRGIRLMEFNVAATWVHGAARAGAHSVKGGAAAGQTARGNKVYDLTRTATVRGLTDQFDPKLVLGRRGILLLRVNLPPPKPHIPKVVSRRGAPDITLLRGATRVRRA